MVSFKHVRNDFSSASLEADASVKGQIAHFDQCEWSKQSLHDTVDIASANHAHRSYKTTMEDTSVDVPDEISCADQIFDIAFHPTCDFLATALIDGAVEVWKYAGGEGSNQMVFRNKLHPSSCRGLKFNDRGDALFTISSDRSLRAIDGSGKEILCYNVAHDKPINRLMVINEHSLVTGDDGGEVKLWDLRAGSQESAAVMQWHMHEDFVSGFAFNSEASTLISVSGDSTLCMYDFRNKKVHCRSDEQESELQCVQILKGGRKVVAGTQDGVMLLFSWDQWGDCSDRFPGHPEAVDCMWKIDESSVLTGSSDGLLRVVSLLPNKVLGVLGDHEEFPVEGMCASRDGRLLGSFAHDEVVRFWDISLFKDDDGDEFDADQEEDPHVSGEKAGAPARSKAAEKRTKAASAAPGVGADGDAVSDDDEEGDGEWEDLDSEDADSDEEEMEMSDDGADTSASGEEAGQEMAESGNSSSSEDEQPNKGPKMLPTANQKFFADL
jgi:WD40 repeat protein